MICARRQPSERAHPAKHSPVRTTSTLQLTSALVLATSVVIASGCNDGKKEQAVDVREACNRLEDVAGVVLSVKSATTAREVQSAIDEPLAAFVEAADQSGDERLAELAHTYDSRFSDYLEGDRIDAREAGNDANIALDRAGARYSELGATNDFPSNSSAIRTAVMRVMRQRCSALEGFIASTAGVHVHRCRDAEQRRERMTATIA